MEWDVYRGIYIEINRYIYIYVDVDMDDVYLRKEYGSKMIVIRVLYKSIGMCTNVCTIDL